MTIDPVHIANQNEPVSPNSGISFNELVHLKLIESLISVIHSYLESIQKNYEKMAIQDRDNERRIKDRKARQKDHSQSKMESHKGSRAKSKSGNLLPPKTAASSTISSGSADKENSSSSTGLGFSYA